MATKREPEQRPLSDGETEQRAMAMARAVLKTPPKPLKAILRENAESKRKTGASGSMPQLTQGKDRP